MKSGESYRPTKEEGPPLGGVKNSDSESEFASTDSASTKASKKPGNSVKPGKET